MGGKWLWAIRGAPPRWAILALGMAPVLLLVGLWWWATAGAVEERLISPTILPSPGEVVRAVRPLLDQRDDEGRGLWGHIGLSLRRVVLGFVLAVAVTVPLGIGMGSFGSVRAVFAPLATAGGYIPIATLVPLTMSWFGTGEQQKVVFLALAFGVFLLPQVVAAVDAVPDVYLRTAATLGASRVQIVFRVLVPVALPGIWHGLRLAFGVGWTYLVLTEVVVLAGGLGHIIEMGRRRGPRENIYLTIIIITVIAWLSDLAWTKAGDLLFPYRKRSA